MDRVIDFKIIYHMVNHVLNLGIMKYADKEWGKAHEPPAL